jgi:hypothetical protein
LKKLPGSSTRRVQSRLPIFGMPEVSVISELRFNTYNSFNFTRLQTIRLRRFCHEISTKSPPTALPRGTCGISQQGLGFQHGTTEDTEASSPRRAILLTLEDVPVGEKGVYSSKIPQPCDISFQEQELFPTRGRLDDQLPFQLQSKHNTKPAVKMFNIFKGLYRSLCWKLFPALFLLTSVILAVLWALHGQMLALPHSASERTT